jgi:lipoate-protein ligase A
MAPWGCRSDVAGGDGTHFEPIVVADPTVPADPLEQPLSILDRSFPSIEENLAFDEALLIRAEEQKEGAVLRFWGMESDAVVLGASRRLREDLFLDRCRRDGVPVARRSSGGGTVVLGPGVLCVTLVLPSEANRQFSAVPTAQRFVLERIAQAIRQLGPRAEVVGSGDLAVQGRKFAGSAQRRLRRWFFVHCSILLDFPIERIVRWLRIPDRQPAYREGRTHEEFLMNLGVSRKILVEAIGSVWPACPLAPAVDVPQDLLSSLLADRFANRAWIERF